MKKLRISNIDSLHEAFQRFSLEKGKPKVILTSRENVKELQKWFESNTLHVPRFVQNVLETRFLGVQIVSPDEVMII